MDYPFIDGISDIQQTQAMSGSRTTANQLSPRNFQTMQPLSIDHYLSNNKDLQNSLNHQSQQHPQSETNPSFASLRDYVQKTLGSWGIKIGYMPENYENKLTINCLMQMISQRFKDQQNRQQLKKSLAQLTFERNKFQSLLQQQKLNNVQKNKAIGRLQNTINDFKNKIKFVEQNTKKEKEEDKKMISMLKSKNQQIMHQMKKKEQQIHRIKEQMKKNLGEKNTFKNVSFQVIEVFRKQQSNQLNDKVTSLSEKYQSQRKIFLRQNLLLRQKLYDIRQQIVNFAQWIDTNIFKQQSPNYKNKLLINHNLLFKKQSIVDQLKQILQDAKSGIKQIISMHEQNRKLSFAKKTETNGRQTMRSKNYEQNRSPNNKVAQNTEFKRKQQPRQTMPTMRKSVAVERANQNARLNQPALKKKSISIQPDFQLDDDCESQLSIISHLSTKEIVAENNKFEKWDFLFNNQ